MVDYNVHPIGFAGGSYLSGILNVGPWSLTKSIFVVS